MKLDHESMNGYTHCPSTKTELASLIQQEMRRHGHRCDLNHIDVSRITDMDKLFDDTLFDGDISRWDVSGVRSTTWMFKNSHFNGDLSAWRLGSLQRMDGMFQGSRFRGDLRSWMLPPAFDFGNARHLFALHNHRKTGVEPAALGTLAIPIWPILVQDMFVYDEQKYRAATHAWLEQTPFCRYHWDLLVGYKGQAHVETASWVKTAHLLHVDTLLPMFESFGLSVLEISKELDASWNAPEHARAMLALPMLD